MKVEKEITIVISGAIIVLTIAILGLSQDRSNCEGTEYIHASKNSLYVVCREVEDTQVQTIKEEFIWKCGQACRRVK